MTVIDVQNLDFSWPNSAFTLSIDNLTISKGEKVFIQGPSGCGKTTLLSLLTGINSISKGSLSILDTQLSRLKGAQRDQFRADHIGVIFQIFNLLPYLTTIENVVLACEFSPTRKNRALQNSPSLEQEAKRLLAHLEINDDSLLNKPVNQLSIGQQQRVAAARALMGSPEIIIADEPTSSLDSDRCEAFMDLLFKEVEESGATLLFVSHDKRLQANFDTVLQLSPSSNGQQSFVSLANVKEGV